MENQIDMFEWLESQKQKPDKFWDNIISFLSDGNRKLAEETEKVNRDKKPIAPKWHLTLNHVWCECPKCKIQPDGLTKWFPPMYGTDGNGHTEYNTHCPWCGQPMLWDWDEIDRQSSQSSDWKWETVKNELNGCQGDCIGCSKSKAIGRYLCCTANDNRRVGDDGGYSVQGHPYWCSRIVKEGKNVKVDRGN